MQPNVPDGYLPSAEAKPDFIHAVPEVHYPSPLNVTTELVDRHVANGRGDRVALRFGDKAITYRELQRRVDQLGNALMDLDVAPGDRVMVRFPNRPEPVVSCLAVQKIGAVALPSMKLLRARELSYIGNNAEISAAMVYDGLLEDFDEAVPELDTLEEVIVAERNGVEHDHHDYDTLMADADDELEAYDTERDDLALMLYTSGTTGRPKGAVHTHRQVLASADSYARYCLEPTADDVFGGNPPLPFAYGYGDLLTFPLRFGATASLVENATPGDLLQAVEDHGITILCSVPTAFNQILAEHPDATDEYDLTPLRLGMSAGEPLAPSTFEAFHEEFGVELLDGIGTTEMLHIFLSHRQADDVDPSATGYAVPGYECKVVDPDTGKEVERGSAGLLAVRGPTGITYWDRPEKQAEAVVDGWSYPGDIFVHHEDGRFEYKSRRDDLIITAGYNVPGPEVENVLQEHEAVAEVAVVGSPDEERGEIVKAFVVLVEEAEASAELKTELQDHVKAILAPYKYPRSVEFIEELPRTETGKIRRTELRKEERED